MANGTNIPAEGDGDGNERGRQGLPQVGHPAWRSFCVNYAT